MEQTINPDVQLSGAERAALVHITRMEGFNVLQKIMRGEVDAFIIEMINSDPSKPREVLSKQVLAKAAGKFYQQVVDRINEEIIVYANEPRPDDKPVDATEGSLDFGALASTLEDESLGGDENE